MPASLPSPTEMLRALVALPSVSSVEPGLDQDNRAVVERIADWAEALGFRCDLMEVPGHPGKLNLLARLGAGEGGLVLSGHTDTVPCDPAAWQSDPFDVVERDGALFGLGTADMKGFFALVLHAVGGLDLSAASLRQPLVLLATADEESTMSGARALADAGTAPGRLCVIGEPTSLQPVRAHKGVAFEIIRVVGRSGHSSDPSAGRSALLGMHRVMTELIAWSEELAREHRDPDFAVPEATMNFGRIAGGDSPNRICARCELHLDVRLVPGMDLDGWRAELRERTARALQGTGLSVEHVSPFGGVPPFAAPHGTLLAAAEELAGPSCTVMFGTEAPFLASLGMETIILGAGDIGVAHRPDEHLPLSQVQAGIDVYRRLVHRICIEAERQPA